MNNIDYYVKEVTNDINNLHESIDAKVNVFIDYVNRKKDEILLAWYADHKFPPKKATIVEERTENGFKCYVREISDDDIHCYKNGSLNAHDIVAGNITYNQILSLDSKDLDKLIKTIVDIRKDRLTDGIS